MNGYLCLVLHAHLPFVRHPEHRYMLEENWFFEAITETYLPLLDHFDMMLESAIPFRLTISLTPTLCAMLADPLLQERYAAHLDRLVELAEKEVKRTRRQPEFQETARMYLSRFLNLQRIYDEVYGRNLIAAFSRFQELGFLEIITCSATHAFLPNMQHQHRAVHAQIAVAVQDYARLFGRPPSGIWLPECGYFRGLESVLHREGIRFFFVDTHALVHAQPKPSTGVFTPLICSQAPVAAFGRDPESSKAVWSADEGYPGHPFYREYYRDIGFECDMDYIRPYIDPIGNRVQTGIKYFRVTDRHQSEKQPYSRAMALQAADEHAADFLRNRGRQVGYLESFMDRPPLIVSPYDAELFGHWWYEGPEWLNFLFRKLAFDQDAIVPVTPSEYLSLHTKNPSGAPLFSSWGEGGFSGMWLDKSNDWVCRHLARMEVRMIRLASQHRHPAEPVNRALNQLARELMLAESSDWTFIMKTGTTVQYATRRAREHIANFLKLCDQIDGGTLDQGFVESLEQRTTIFPELDYRIYARDEKGEGRRERGEGRR